MTSDAGYEVSGFVLVINGRVDIYMTGPLGREILLYSVTPGETCVQTTLGLLSKEDYSADAVVLGRKDALTAGLLAYPLGVFSTTYSENPKR